MPYSQKNKWSLLINKFCKYPDSIWANPKAIKREVKITKKLFKIVKLKQKIILIKLEKKFLKTLTKKKTI